MNRRVWMTGSLLALQSVLAQAANVLIDGIPGHITRAPYQGWHYASRVSWSYQKSNTAQPFKLQATLEQRAAGFATIKQTAFNGGSIKHIIVDHFATISTGQSVVARLTCENAAIIALSFSAEEFTTPGSDIPTVELELGCAKLLWEDFEYSPQGTPLRSGKGENAFIFK